MQGVSTSARQCLPVCVCVCVHSCSGKGRLKGNVGSHHKYLEVTESALWFHMAVDGGGFWNVLWNAPPPLKGLVMLSSKVLIRWCWHTVSECGVCVRARVHFFLSFTKCLKYSTGRHFFLPVWLRIRFSSHTSHLAKSSLSGWESCTFR